jgi:hypothetical protein
MYISSMDYITDNTTSSGLPPQWTVTVTTEGLEFSYEYIEDLYYDEETDSYR